MHRGEDFTRHNYINNILLEVKMRCYSFLSTYLDLLPIGTNAPITLDEYATSLNYLKNNNHFLNSYDFHYLENHEISDNLDIIYNNDDEQIFEKSHFYFECAFSTKSNRSSRLLLTLPTKDQNNYVFHQELIPLYQCTLSFYLNYEYEAVIIKKRNTLSESFKSNKASVYRNYININQKINIYSSLSKNLKIDKHSDLYKNKQIKNGIDYQRERFNYLSKKNSELNKEFSNIIMAKSAHSSLRLSKVSIIIALISLLLTLFISLYPKDNKTKTTTQESISQSGKE